jgi:tRNA pseudouridine38-40 synthase
MFQRYFLEISYKGTEYHGWQTQHNAVTVQEEIETALGILLSKHIPTTGCGRTDTGVHAMNYFLHFDAELLYGVENLVFRLNKLLPKDIVAHALHEMRQDAHARFSALKRTYQYDLGKFKNPFNTEVQTHLHYDLNIDLMNEAAQFLLGKNDFTALCKVSEDVLNNLSDVQYAKWTDLGGGNIRFTITADRFLRGMVRIVVGTLLDVGRSKMSVNEFKNVIKSENRKMASAAAPPQGLFLAKVDYPSELFIKVLSKME